MALQSGAVWAIDIGNNSLKALRLRAVDEAVEVTGFDNIQHGKILSGAGVQAAEKKELIAISLRQFVKENNIGKENVIISVPGQNSFARFVGLPPVEQKRIPEIVKFEAAQQIPFDINDVQWDWQLMTGHEGADVRVGIFAIKNEVVTAALEHFSTENINVTGVQMTPMALYNYGLYDNADIGKSDKQATVILNIGADGTDLVVCTKTTVWQRGVSIGGNAFTRAIAEAFKLNFEKAEKLKRTAPMSKYARQILQAMKPVFTDLASEIQRSLGFYTSSNPTVKLAKIIAMGGGTKMRGLINYLQQTLQIPIERPDSFKRIVMSPDVSAAKFHENVCDFGVVYGLALQGLGLSRIESNLLPRSIARSMLWTSKTKYFAMAACVLLVVTLMSMGRTLLDRTQYLGKSAVRQRVSNIVKTAEQAGSSLKTQESKGAASEAVIQKTFDLFKYRDVIPSLYQIIISALPNEENNPEQKELYEAFRAGDRDAVMKTARGERKQLFVTGMSIYFTKDVSTAQLGGGRGRLRTPGVPGEEDEEDEGGWASPASTAGTRSGQRGAVPDEVGPGFIVTMTGYSPYENIGELLDPSGVDNNKSRWGFVTRLMHLEDANDVNSPFKLYQKAKLEHFKLETGEVSYGDAALPAGTGVSKESLDKGKKDAASSGRTAGSVLVDPMTREVISKVEDLDEYGRKKVGRTGNPIYKVNDHWFVLNAKFFWKQAPKK